MSNDELTALAREIIDSNTYMTLATADETGRPWASPVYYAVEDYTRFHWVSSPEARHSRNVAARREVAIVIFDSTAPIGGAQATYMAAVADELTGRDLERGIELFGRISRADGARDWGLEAVQPPSPFRLYRATVSEHFVLIRGGDPERGSGVDRRERVKLP